MEKQYIWFDTGMGCLASVVGLTAAGVALLVLFPHVGASPWLFFAATLGLLLAALWLPFRVDVWRKRRQRAAVGAARSGRADEVDD